MSIKRDVQTYTARRVVLSSSRPIEQVVSALYEATNKKQEGRVAVLMATAKDREELERGMAELTEGKRSFLLFGGGAHSRWMNTYYEGEQSFEQAYTFMIGNPLLAKEMLKHDMGVGLHVPPKVLVQEIKGGGTKIVYQLPTSWLGDDVPEVLKEHMQTVETKLEELFTNVLTPKSVSKF